MAGWVQWDDIQVATSSSVGKTVLEAIWPEVVRIAQDQGWQPEVWVDRLMAVLATLIVRIKCNESPILDREEDLQNAIIAGEIFASVRFHPTVWRFQTAQNGIDWIMNFVRGHPPAARALPAHITAVLHLPANAAVLALLPNDQGLRVGWDADLTFETYVRWLYITKADEAVTTIVGNALIAYVSGMCKLGEMTTAWQNSRIRQIRREAQNPDLELTKAVCSHVWDFYGVAFRPAADQFGPFFVWLEQQCEAKRMTRLFITAQQSAEQGCTVLNLIADAQRLCDDFNWDRFINPQVPAEREIRRELDIWGQDFEAMKQNAWIRFSGEAGRSPLMANVGYLSKQLLTRALGQMAFNNYAGLDMGNLTIRHRVWIDRIVQQYIDHLNRPVAGQAEREVARRPGEQNAQHRLLNQAVLRPNAARPDFNAPVVFQAPVARANAVQVNQNQQGAPPAVNQQLLQAFQQFMVNPQANPAFAQLLQQQIPAPAVPPRVNVAPVVEGGQGAQGLEPVDPNILPPGAGGAGGPNLPHGFQP